MLKLSEGVTLINGQSHGGRTSLAVALLYDVLSNLKGTTGKVVYIADKDTLMTIYQRLDNLAKENHYASLTQLLNGYDLVLRDTLHEDDFINLGALVIDKASLSDELTSAKVALLNHVTAPTIVVVPVTNVTDGYGVSPYNPQLRVTATLTVTGSQLLSTSEDSYLYLMELVELRLDTLVARPFNLKVTLNI